MGSQNKATRAKVAVEAEYRAFMLREQRALWLAQRERAIGVYVLLVKTEDGYKRVTDPEQIATIVSKPAGRGTKHWLIEAQPADVQLAKEINNRTMGVPAQLHEMGTSDGDALPVRIVMQHEKG